MNWISRIKFGVAVRLGSPASVGCWAQPRSAASVGSSSTATTARTWQTRLNIHCLPWPKITLTFLKITHPRLRSQKVGAIALIGNVSGQVTVEIRQRSRSRQLLTQHDPGDRSDISRKCVFNA